MKRKKEGDTSIRVDWKLHSDLDDERKLLKKEKRYETFKEMLRRLLREAKEREADRMARQLDSAGPD